MASGFDEWESKVDELEQYVKTQGFVASHGHAHDVVEYALGECQTAFAEQLHQLQQLVGVVLAPLKELARQVEQSAETVVSQSGAELKQELDRTHATAGNGVAALDRVKQHLAQYSFVDV